MVILQQLYSVNASGTAGTQSFVDPSGNVIVGNLGIITPGSTIAQAYSLVVPGGLVAGNIITNDTMANIEVIGFTVDPLFKYLAVAVYNNAGDDLIIYVYTLPIPSTPPAPTYTITYDNLATNTIANISMIFSKSASFLGTAWTIGTTTYVSIVSVANATLTTATTLANQTIGTYALTAFTLTPESCRTKCKCHCACTSTPGTEYFALVTSTNLYIYNTTSSLTNIPYVPVNNNPLTPVIDGYAISSETKNGRALIVTVSNNLFSFFLFSGGEQVILKTLATTVTFPNEIMVSNCGKYYVTQTETGIAVFKLTKCAGLQSVYFATLAGAGYPYSFDASGEYLVTSTGQNLVTLFLAH